MKQAKLTKERLINDYKNWCKVTGVSFMQYREDFILKSFGFEVE